MQAIRCVTASNYSALTCRMRHIVRSPMACVAQVNHRRHATTETLTVPTPEGLPKVYPEKIQSIVKEISQLNLIEVADLNELLKKTLNIPDAPVMAYGAPAGAPAAQEEEDEVAEPVKVQTSFTVHMKSYDQTKKVQLIKEVKSRLEGYNLVQAKKFVESCPCVVKADVAKDEAEQLAEAFKAVGAECVIE